eukprot:6174812-Pleurochrysis_carterae.AAC.2
MSPAQLGSTMAKAHKARTPPRPRTRARPRAHPHARAHCTCSYTRTRPQTRTPAPTLAPQWCGRRAALCASHRPLSMRAMRCDCRCAATRASACLFVGIPSCKIRAEQCGQARDMAHMLLPRR